MNSKRFNTHRFRAFIWHLCFSVCLGLFALAMVLLVWYPAPLYKAVGVMFIFLLLLGVDLVLGPCLTFAVATPGKKKSLLWLDLSVILTVQLSAYFYGLYTVAEGRPTWLVVSPARADIVRIVDLDPAHLAKAPPEYQHPPLSGPQWVCAPLPDDVETRNTLLFDAIGGNDIHRQPRFYRPIAECGDFLRDMKKNALDTLKSFNDEEAVNRVLVAYPEADAWIPLLTGIKANSQDMVALLHGERILGAVDLRPNP